MSVENEYETVRKITACDTIKLSWGRMDGWMDGWMDR